jgi:hypothetical protein
VARAVMGATIAPNCGPDESCVAPLVPDKPAELAKCKDCKDDLVEARLRQLHLDFVDCPSTPRPSAPGNSKSITN